MYKHPKRDLTRGGVVCIIVVLACMRAKSMRINHTAGFRQTSVKLCRRLTVFTGCMHRSRDMLVIIASATLHVGAGGEERGWRYEISTVWKPPTHTQGTAVHTEHEGHASCTEPCGGIRARNRRATHGKAIVPARVLCPRNERCT